MNNSNKIIDSSGCYWRETWSHTTYWSKSSMIIKPDIIFTSLAEYNLHRGRAQNTPRAWADFIINNDAINDALNDHEEYNNSIKKTVAVVYFGLLRSLSSVYKSHYENIFNILNENNLDYKIFIHTWKTIDDKQRIWNRDIDIKQNYEQHTLLKPHKYTIDNQEEFIDNVDFSKYFYKDIFEEFGESKYGGEWLPYLIKNHLCELESKKRGFKMVLLDEINFDYVIFLRPDMKFENKFPVNMINHLEINKNGILIPNQWHGEGVNDQFAMINYNNSQYYANRIDGLADYRKENGRIVSEKYVKHIVNKYYIPQFINLKYDIIRCDEVSKNFLYEDVVRHDNDILYMAYYFPQYHITPENKIQLMTDNMNYTDWDVVKTNNRSFTPLEYYNLTDPVVIEEQDKYANENRIGAFIFYHYWLNNSMVLNHPVELFMQKKRKTKFALCWDNESGYLGTQYYDEPEKHAYQLLRYFKNENYLTDKNGKKPFMVYLTPKMDTAYISRFCKFLEMYDVSIKFGHHFQHYHNNWALPHWSEIACEFGPWDHQDGPRRDISKYNIKDTSDFATWWTGKEYWQGAISSWDSRPRSNTVRTHQVKCSQDTPNGVVSVEAFKVQLKKIKDNIHPMNKDKIITLFAWNEWAEGAVLEKSEEFGEQFIKCL